jgi:hypothetical protein
MSAVIDQSDEFSQRMSHGMNKFHTLLHRSKNITLLFSGDSALFAKNTRRWGCVDFEPSTFNFQLSTFNFQLSTFDVPICGSGASRK